MRVVAGGGSGMGPRIREDNGGAGAHEGRPYADAGGQMGSGMGARYLDSASLRLG